MTTLPYSDDVKRALAAVRRLIRRRRGILTASDNQRLQAIVEGISPSERDWVTWCISVEQERAEQRRFIDSLAPPPISISTEIETDPPAAG